MPPISLLIKPASSNCNLRCKYCFYHSIAENRTTASYGTMSLETMENLIKKALLYADNFCTFAFQGGEPTIAGLEFYEKFIELIKIHNTKKIKINLAIQTNGMLINEEWASFFSENKFLVGLSLDGSKDIHDLNRVDGKKSGTFNRVMKTVELFNKMKVEYNILYVVTAHSSRYADKIYKFFKQNDFKYIQFIPCLDPLDEERAQHPYSLKPEALSKFLKITFDRWYEDFTKNTYVSIRYFDNLVSMILGYPPEACNMNGRCQCQCVVEADGGVYPCDFYVFDKWYLGNIKNMGLKEIMNSEIANKFVEASFATAEECKECKWYVLCRGGCRREREVYKNETLGLNYYCSAYKDFFEYAYSKLLTASRIIARK
jgi:uncharacterized protein